VSLRFAVLGFMAVVKRLVGQRDPASAPGVGAQTTLDEGMKTRLCQAYPHVHPPSAIDSPLWAGGRPFTALLILSPGLRARFINPRDAPTPLGEENIRFFVYVGRRRTVKEGTPTWAWPDHPLATLDAHPGSRDLTHI